MVLNQLHIHWGIYRVSSIISIIQAVLTYNHPVTHTSHPISHRNMSIHLNILGEKETFMAAAAQWCGISHPVRHPSILCPLSRRNPSWQLSISTSPNQIKALSMIPGSSWNQTFQTCYDGSRFLKKSLPRSPSNIPGRNIGLFFIQMGNHLGLKRVL